MFWMQLASMSKVLKIQNMVLASDYSRHDSYFGTPIDNISIPCLRCLSLNKYMDLQ